MPAGSRPDRRVTARPAQLPDDGTRQLLQWGGTIVGTGLVAAVLLLTVLGGYTPTGATTNTGWFALIIVLMCIPFGLMLFGLGVAKWFRNRRIARGTMQK